MIFISFNEKLREVKKIKIDSKLEWIKEVNKYFENKGFKIESEKEYINRIYNKDESNTTNRLE